MRTVSLLFLSHNMFGTAVEGEINKTCGALQEKEG